MSYPLSKCLSIDRFTTSMRIMEIQPTSHFIVDTSMEKTIIRLFAQELFD